LQQAEPVERCPALGDFPVGQLVIEDAIAYASRGHGRRGRPATGWSSLTPTEVQIARLVARHLPNPQIAQQLFISRATVKTHLVHIFAKLSISSRSQLAAEAIQHGVY
jgi:DNA-binding CsgD family transcriptional regulator